MVRTVNAGFDEFLKALVATKIETEAARSGRKSIETCLESNFGLLNFFRPRSFGNGTSISGRSDVDYFAVIPVAKLKQNSATTLTQMRNVLDTRFPQTGIHVSTPEVVVPFGDVRSETTEVIPADYATTSSGYRIYDIPDTAGGWIKSAPKGYDDYIAEVDKKLSGKVRSLIRFVKA